MLDVELKATASGQSFLSFPGVPRHIELLGKSYVTGLGPVGV